MAALTCPLKCAASKPRSMKMNQMIALPVLLLAACSHEPAGVRLTLEKAVTTTPAVAAKVEPVFYNGKTYQVAFTPTGNGDASLSISGMTSAQSKDAAGLAQSTFHHFSCKDTQKAVMTVPAFDGGTWKSSGHCA